jgi:hypothetical protein
MSVDRADEEKGMEMATIRHNTQASRETRDHGTLRRDREASARALLAADNAHVHEAMNSVTWERRGILQRLTRRAR